MKRFLPESSSLLKLLAAAALVAGVGITAHGTAQWSSNLSEWATVIWPRWVSSDGSMTVSMPIVFAELSPDYDDEVRAVWVNFFFQPVTPGHAETWFRVRAQCYPTSAGPKGGRGVRTVGYWITTDVTGPGGGPPEAWVACPEDKPYPFDPQVQVQSKFYNTFQYWRF